MQTRFEVVVLLGLVICVAGPAPARSAGDETDRARTKHAAEPGRGESFVSVLTRHTGEPILVVKYPWKRHARPSVEVRILDEEEVDNRLIRPLFFMHDIFKGEVTTAVYHCVERSEDVPLTAAFSRGEIDFTIFGARNSLGRPSASVACRTTTVDPPPETRAAFCLLDTWAVDQRTLYLDLPSEYFARPRKIRVWFLRDKDIVWTADTTWPGTPE